MAVNFPDSPSNGATFSSNGLTFTWNGEAWKLDPSSGTKGDKGQKGEVGVTGDKGQKGDVGDKGQKGEIGATGGSGGAGDKGQKGEIGEKGATGSTGVKGQKGEVGAAGGTGGAGDKGSAGEKGDKGAPSTVAGDKGQKGEIGTAGDKGATGAGDKGQKGEEGPQGGGAPVGQIVSWSGSAGSLPTGYFLCDGSAVSRSTYAALYAIVGTTHGSGNGSTTFNLPDLRGKFVVGHHPSNGDYDVGDTGGAESVTLTTAQMPSHKHDTTFDNKKYFPGGGSTSVTYGGAGGYPADVFSMSNQGGGQAHENRPPFYALCYIIQYAQGGDVAKGEKGVSGSATKGEPGTSVKGEPGSSVKGEPGNATKGEPGSSTKGEPGTSVKGEPGSSVKGEPGTSVKGEPGSNGSASIFNNADNRIITGSSSAGSLNAETGFTFDGSNASMTSGSNNLGLNAGDGAIEITRSSGSAYIDFRTTTGEDFDIRLQQDGTSDKLKIYNYAGTGGDLDVAGTITNKCVAKAFVNFHGGTNTNGNCTLRDSFGVSSVSDNSTGNYTVNWSSNFPNVNYTVTVSHSAQPHNNSTHGVLYTNGYAVNYVNVVNFADNSGGNLVDKNVVCVVARTTHT